MTQPHAVIAGAGIGGLAAAASLHQQGWRVTVCERAPRLEPVGSGLAVAANGLRALDTLGVGDEVRRLAAIQGEAVVQRPDGRVLSRTSSDAIARRFGEPVVLALRASLYDVLLGLLPADAIRTGVAAVGVDPGDASRPARLLTEDGAIEADLVVAADGVNSVLRGSLFPEHPGPRFSGYTAWRFLAPAPASDFLPGETWGGGKVFGITPLIDGRIYAYAAAHAEPGVVHADERAELLRMFEGWHAAIPDLIVSAESGAVLHNDVYEMATPLPAYHSGRVAILGDAAHAMTPHLGQGACHALEDAVTLGALLAGRSGTDVPAVLSRYTELRLPRGVDIVRRSHKVGALTQTASRPKEAVRNFLVRTASRVAPDTVLRSLDPVLAWRPPTVTGTAPAPTSAR